MYYLPLDNEVVAFNKMSCRFEITTVIIEIKQDQNYSL